MTDRALEDLPGLGPKTVAWLRDVGINSEADLRALGAVAVYRRLKHWNPKRVSRNALWGLHAALLGIPWTSIDAATKRHLLEQAGEITD